MPLMLVVVLGVVQLGMIAHARLMAKYAAYRAVRVGAMNHANVGAMENAALLHLLPVLVDNSQVISSTRGTSQILGKLTRAQAENIQNAVVPGAKLVRVVICGPEASEVRGTGSQPLDRADQLARWGIGSGNEVDFDDPGLHIPPSADDEDVVASEWTQWNARNVRLYNRTRLRIQLQFLYRMPIPLANWVISHTYLGIQLPSALMMPGQPSEGELPVTRQRAQVRAAAARGVYVLPINVSYAMRMQSNFFLGRYPLPTSNQCIHYENPNP